MGRGRGRGQPDAFDSNDVKLIFIYPFIRQTNYNFTLDKADFSNEESELMNILM